MASISSCSSELRAAGVLLARSNPHDLVADLDVVRQLVGGPVGGHRPLCLEAPGLAADRRARVVLRQGRARDVDLPLVLQGDGQLGRGRAAVEVPHEAETLARGLKELRMGDVLELFLDERLERKILNEGSPNVIKE